MSSAGKFELNLSEPYPVWVTLKIDGEEVARLTHHDLRDLEYAANKAMREAKMKLPHGDRHEV